MGIKATKMEKTVCAPEMTDEEILSMLSRIFLGDGNVDTSASADSGWA